MYCKKFKILNSINIVYKVKLNEFNYLIINIFILKLFSKVIIYEFFKCCDSK